MVKKNIHDGQLSSTLIYRGNPEITKEKNDDTQQIKYILSEDNIGKLMKVIDESKVNIKGTQIKVGKMMNRGEAITMNYGENYNIFTTAKLDDKDPNIYLLWFTENDSQLTFKNYFTIENWETVKNIYVKNDKIITILGSKYGPSIKNETIDIYPDNIKGVLEIVKDNAEEIN
jgi:hypothetical protein